jgi:hypothetical protein
MPARPSPSRTPEMKGPPVLLPPRDGQQVVAADDLPAGTSVVVYGRLEVAPDETDRVAAVIRWCQRRELNFRGAFIDWPRGGPAVWAAALAQLQQVDAAAVVVPDAADLGEGDHAAWRLSAAAKVGAVVAAAPGWELRRTLHLGGIYDGGTLQAGVVEGGVTINFAAERPPPPRMLPDVPGPADWPQVQRAIAELDAVEPHDSGQLLVVIFGAPGTGKTTAALAWLRSRQWPDGELFARLSLVDAVPTTPDEVFARSWLPALGVPAGQLPGRLAEQAVYFRGLARGRTFAVLLDDAISAAQVRPLLPHTPGVVLVTTRRMLSGLSLDGARYIGLNEPGDDED